MRVIVDAGNETAKVRMWDMSILAYQQLPVLI